jgi:transcriptional regulator with PAS, ATPase and Fis domain
LRVLQNQEVQRVGSLTAHKVDVRVIAATHRDLQVAIEEKKFREDLYYRLAMVEIHVPRLSERLGDLTLLARHFVSKFGQQYGKEIRGLTRRAEIQLEMHTWPGNIRELENVIGHAAMMTMSEMIDIYDLPPYMQGKGGHPALSPVSTDFPAAGTLEEQERILVVRAQEASGGNQSKAARQLRIGRDALRYKMKKHGLEPANS